MSLHYLVKGGCSKFFIILALLQSDCSDLEVKEKMAYCHDNFIAQRPLSDIRRLCGDDFFYVPTGLHFGASARDTVAFLERERCEKCVVV